MELTTGQMIDQLKAGEVAESDRYNLKVTKTDAGRIRNLAKSDGHLVLNFHTTDTLWKILPRYVTFEEAMKALKDGYGVTLHLEDGGYITFCEADKLRFVADEAAGITFSDLAKDRWTIEED